MFIRTLLMAGLAAGAAAAGDLSPVAAEAPVFGAAPASALRGSWSGGYVGLQLSYGTLDGHQSFGDKKTTGGFYGGLLGYRFDAGRFVIGGEISYDRTDVDFPNGTNVDNLLKAGMSVGYDFGRYLPYVSGGYAGVSLANDPLDFDEEYDGGFIGVGIAYQVTDHIILGGEIDHEHFDADGTRVDMTTYAGKLSYRF